MRGGGAALFAAVVAAAAAGGVRAADLPAILQPGMYHGNQVPDDAGGTWWAVCGQRERIRLEPVRVEVVAELDPILDESPLRRTGKRVEASGCDAPVFLVRGIARLERRVVSSALPFQDAGGGVRGSSFGGKPLVFRELAQGAQRSIVMEYHGTRRALVTAPAGEGARWEVPWAGDLDADGRPDALLVRADPAVGRTVSLFLSTGAPAEDLVSEVARLVAPF